MSSLPILGRLAPRWAYDFLDGTLPCQTDIEKSADARLFAIFNSKSDHRHEFRVLHNQTTNEGQKYSVISLLCVSCDYHFVVKTQWDYRRGDTLCNGGGPTYYGSRAYPPPHTARLAHFLVHQNKAASSSTNSERSSSGKPPSHISTESFACSTTNCPFQVQVDIYEPALRVEWLAHLTDAERIRKRLEVARKEQPERYGPSCDTWNEGLTVFNTYLLNLLNPQPDRRISKRNKRFHVVIGDDLYDMMRVVGFQDDTVENDGVREEVFVPTSLEPLNPGEVTQIGTLRSLVEVMQASVECHLQRSKGWANSQLSESGIDNCLETALHCRQWPRTSPTHLLLSPNEPEFSKLGILPNMHKSLVHFSYQRLVQRWPEHAHGVAETLYHIASKLQDEDLHGEAALAMSRCESQTGNQATADIQRALDFFGIKGAPGAVPDHMIVAAFRNRMQHSPGPAQEHMLALARHRNSSRLTEVLEQRQMSLETAIEVIEGGRFDDDNELAKAAEDKMNRSSTEEQGIGLRLELIEALNVLGVHRENGRFFKMAQFLRDTLVGVEDVADTTTGRPDLPVGLQNIGNTCYLNSILQYLFTVNDVRELVFGYTQHRLELTDDAIAERRVGGSMLTINRAEAVVAQAFMDELLNLFENLKTSPAISIRPTQRLANAVLISTRQISKSLEQSKADNKALPAIPDAQFPAPPPLPARPSPPVPFQKEKGKSAEDTAMQEIGNSEQVSVSVDAVSEGSSTKTLVDDLMDVERPSIEAANTEAQADSDNVMTGTAEEQPPASDDERIRAALETQKRSSGTEQQDVEEVIGSILHRIQAAIRPSNINEGGIQEDIISRLTGVRVAMYTKSPDKRDFRSQTTVDRSITAYPAEEGQCTIEEAVARGFDQEIIEETNMVRFTAIKAPTPPILYVHIQRTKKTGQKNGNPVTVKEMLYLDRFMDAPTDSLAHQYRLIGWCLQNRHNLASNYPRSEAAKDAEKIRTMEEFITEELVNPARVPTIATTPQDSGFEDLLTDRPTSTFKSVGHQQFDWTMNGPKKGQPKREAGNSDAMDTDPSSLSIPTLDTLEAMAKNLAVEEAKKVEAWWATQRKEAYRLHAVICHSGQLNAGHYWVWIYDFEAGIWRKYNDESVTEHADTAEVLATLNKGGEPYYLCYVRDSEKQSLVDVPARELPTFDVDLTGQADGEDSGHKSAATVEIDVDKDDGDFVPLSRQESRV